VRSKVGALSISVLAVAFVATGCSETKNTDSGSSKQNIQTGAISYDAADNTGPAKAVPGATKGGTLTVMQIADFEHLDPARSYVNIQQVAGALIYRTLTGFKEEGAGKLKLVGDLATNPGTDVNKDCKTWEYKIRTGVKYEDGTTVKAADVAYGIARSFSPDLSEGAHYIQSWLADNNDYNATYKGPYNGGAALPPGVTVPDDTTIRFTFAKPHCDLPYAVSMPLSAPVPAAKDTKANYDLKPFSSGPYMVSSYKRDVELDLVRNPNWDASTDPMRTAYPEGYKFTFGLEADQISERLVADGAADQASLMQSDVPPAVLPKTTAAGVAERVVKGSTQYVWYYYINTQRITDLNVRKALNYALDKDAVLKAIGGTAAGEAATTLMSPTVAGYKKYDVFGAPVTGDLTKVKELLAGKTVNLVMAHANTAVRTAQAAAASKSLENAGFKVTLKAIDAANYYTEVGKKNNPYDIYLGGWGSDWPAGGTVIPPLFDGSAITPEGNQNLSYLNDPAINAEIKRIQDESAEKQESEWAALDQKIMDTDAPVVPAYYDKTYELTGSKIGNAFLSDAFGVIALNNIYVKQ
jgi:peptide/nickel transport system substrate-binding protein